MSDPRGNAARYWARQTDRPDGEAAAPAPVQLTAENKHEFVESAIQVAIRRGEFDDLPGAGKPLENLGTPNDPDWWIRRKIETENLTGLGPPALLLRTEDRGLDDQLDVLGRESDVREVLEDFNKRVIDARRQLMGGPPVVTRTRDVDAEVAAWRERRAPSTSVPEGPAPVEETAPAEEPRRGWFRRG
ncbi:DnaJ family domain-containing protein [Microbacterium sp. GXF0217]